MHLLNGSITMDFIGLKNNLKISRILDSSSNHKIAFADDEVLFKIEKFGLTANNIIYAAFGEATHYWNFFPVNQITHAEANHDWGRIPAWRFASVEPVVAKLKASEESLYIGEVV